MTTHTFQHLHNRIARWTDRHYPMAEPYQLTIIKEGKVVEIKMLTRQGK